MGRENNSVRFTKVKRALTLGHPLVRWEKGSKTPERDVLIRESEARHSVRHTKESVKNKKRQKPEMG